MRTTYFYFFLCLLLACQESSPPSSSKINTFPVFQTEFTQPTKEFRTAPLWVWNDLMTRPEIDRNLSELKQAGFGGAFVHPRPGLISQYMSTDWYDLFQYAVAKGKELDMNIWIYDENSYPSGFAGGHVPAEMPESYNQGQGLVLHKLSEMPDSVGQYFICLEEKDGKFTDITATAQTKAKQSGNFYLYAKTYERKSDWYGGFSYVDLLYKGVTEKFIDITMKGYEKVAKADFGKTVPGIFTDEPNVAPPGGIRWTPDLFDIFQTQWGYDLKTQLPALFEEVGEWKTVRHNYNQTLLQLFIDRWAKPYHAYCQQNNLKLTGHYWEHGWPDLGHGGDNMAMYAWHQLPAIDMLFNQFNDESPQAQFGNVRAVKELSSVANQMGYNRTLSETYGGAGWEESFQDFKRLGDWEYVLGVNFMNQHLNHSTIVGARKYDYPPTFSYHSPWWAQYGAMNHYFARLSVTLAAGQQLNDVLVLEPTSSIWLYYSNKQHSDALWAIGRTFQTFVTDIEKLQVEYDLGSENIIKDQGRVLGDRFIIGQRSYKTVVIPPLTENLDKPTFLLLKQFADKGGVIAAFASPSYLDGKQNDEITQFFATHKAVTHLTATEAVKKFSSPDLQLDQVQGGLLFHHRRTMEDGQIVFLTNTSLSENSTAKLSVKGKSVIALNAFTGAMTQVSGVTTSATQVSLPIDLPPAGSLLLYVFDTDLKQNFPANVLPNEKMTTLPSSSPLNITAEEKNVLAIDFVDLQIAKERWLDMHVYDAADAVFKHHGFVGGNPWNTSVQYKDNIVKRDTFTTGGFVASYQFTIGNQVDLAGLEAVVERSELYKIQINGRDVSPIPNRWWLDRKFGVLDIAPFVHTGRNTLTLTLSKMSIHAEIEPVYILGNFSLISANKGWTLAPEKPLQLGSWKQQGRPFYAKSVQYTKTYNDLDTAKHYQVQLGSWHGTVAEVLVNKQSAGIIFAAPYQLDISSFITKGTNSISVRIVGSNKNLLGPFHGKANPGFVSPWSFRGVKAYPAGEAYQQFDDGLMADFEVIRD